MWCQEADLVPGVPALLGVAVCTLGKYDARSVIVGRMVPHPFQPDKGQKTSDGMGQRKGR